MISLRPWTASDRIVLDETIGNASMMTHLGGPEDAAALDRRHEKYLALGSSGTGEMFTLAFQPEGDAIGTVGYWRKTWADDEIFETGWQVLPAFAGRGVATQAARAIVAMTRSLRERRYLHAFPSIHNEPSNRVCASARFTNLGQCSFEYPKGSLMTCHDWRYDLEPNG